MKSRRSVAQALVWFTLALPMFVTSAGLAIDGGMLLIARRQLQSVADGAARAGATRLDLDVLRASGGSDVQLDPRLATEAARQYVAERAPLELMLDAPPTTAVVATNRRVHVEIHATLPTAFMRIAHVDTVRVEASAFADVQFGIRSGRST
jgi:uncharacterized membrane protein